MVQFIFVIILITVTIVFVIGIRRALRMSSKSVELIEKYELDKNNPQLVQEIFDAISNDILLGRIINEHSATIDDINKLHKKLMEWGDFRKYNRYIPITSFFNVTALRYLLEHKNEDAKSLTEKMMNHFHI